MSTQVVTLESAKAIPLPPETAEAFGLHAGSRVAVTVRDGAIVLQPLLAESLDELCGTFSRSVDPTNRNVFDDIKALRGVLASERGMVEELQEERRQDKW